MAPPQWPIAAGPEVDKTNGDRVSWWAIKTALLPPGGLILFAVAGWLLLHRRPRTGRAVLLVTVVIWWTLSTPFVASRLLASLQPATAAAPEPPDGAVIVVLAAGSTRPNDDPSTARPDRLGLERLDRAVRLHHRTNLPLVASGGEASATIVPAELMAATLRDVYGVAPVRTETSSHDTWTSACATARLLRADGVATVLLVTHGWHMPRAARAFRAHGLDVVPVAAGVIGPVRPSAAAFVPSPKAALQSYYAVYERLGSLWYARRRPCAAGEPSSPAGERTEERP
jgi:uncharacterized SAM-binding protein YcdF (DUF218 family)